MATDAKLGLILGIAIVLLLGIVFSRKESSAASTEPVAPAQIAAPRGPATP